MDDPPILFRPEAEADMKVTIHIPESLLRQARRLVVREGITLTALVERCLHQVGTEKVKSETFRLRKATFRGKGLQPDICGVTGEHLRDLAYKGRGT
ncbi:MAG: DUF2191 domain-containing protein [Proteobacteria bacterium]|nr:DUF2191 domain-containing protein [Pseudomonadota bacterium]